MGSVTPLMLALMQAQGQPMQPMVPTVGNLNLPTGAGQMQPTGMPLAQNTTPPTQVPSYQQPLPFEQQASPGVAGSQLAQQNQQAQSAGTLAGAIGAANAGSGGAAASGAAAGGMASALPYLLALQYIQAQTAPPSIGGGRGGGYTESGGLF